MGFWRNLKNTVVGMMIGGRMGAVEMMNTRDFVEEALEDRKDRFSAFGRSSRTDLAKSREAFEKEVQEKGFWSAKESLALAEFELALEDSGWRDLAYPAGQWNFTRLAINKMMGHSRVMYLVNPLIKRAVTVQELYVWGSGCTIKAPKSEVLQGVLDKFFNDPKNQCVIGEAWPEREREQRIDGNTFFVMYINRVNGEMRVRLIPPEEIAEIICNPNDKKEVRYYRRAVPQGTPDENDVSAPAADGVKSIMYPDIMYEPWPYTPLAYDNVPIKWDARIIHVKTGGIAGMKFGVPELLSAINWATAYKKFLENFATLMQAYARWAVKISGNAGKAGVAAAKSKLNTAISGTQNTIDKNPPQNTASIFPTSGSVDISAIKTRGSTTAPDEARALRTMVAAGTDTPEHFFGDAELGKLATAKTLDRPTELKMVARQTMWEEVILKMCRMLEMWSARAPQGTLREAGWTVKIERDPFNGDATVTVTAPKKDKKPLNIIEVRFPAIIQADIVDRVRAVVQAATLGGRKAEGIFPKRDYLFKLLMLALGEDRPDELVQEMYPKTVEQGFSDPAVEQEIDMMKAKKPAAAPGGGGD